MSISPLGASFGSIGGSSEEVDEHGNLKGFVVEDSPVEKDEGQAAVSHPRRTRRSKRLAREKRSRKVSGILNTGSGGRKKARSVYHYESEDSDYEPEERPKQFPHSRMIRELYTAFDTMQEEHLVGRQEEALRILSMVMQPQGGVRPLLLGPAGVGVYSVVKKAAKILKTTLKDHPLGNRSIYCLDCNELLAEGPAEEAGARLRETFESALRLSVKVHIFYFRHIEKILHLDHVTEYLQSLLRRPYPFVASISSEPKSETVAKALQILSRYNFTPMEVGEPPIDDVLEIVSTHLSRHRLHPKLSFSEEAVSLGVRLAAKYVHGQPFPVKAINLIQESANHVLLSRMTSAREVEDLVVNPEHIADVVSRKTKVPPLDLLDHSVFNQERFVKRLKRRVVGQDHAIAIVSDRVAAFKMRLVDPRKPWGVFLFVGPTGVGKTELARSLAKFLFNDETNLITINGSEYIEDHTVSNLIGSPKGYEGNESGGLLTEPLKKNPNQVVLLDEFEKAHPNVQKLFLQVFDGAPLIDRKGDQVDCSQALFIMTSNVGSQMLSEAAGRGPMSPNDIIDKLVPHLKQAFSPELVGRFKRGIVPFQPLNREMMPAVAVVKLKSIRERLLNAAEIDFTWTSELVQYFSEAEVDLGFGMREFCNMIDETVVNLIKDAILQSDQRITGKLELTYRKEEKDFFLRVRKKS